jgi:hypothetical protein
MRRAKQIQEWLESLRCDDAAARDEDGLALIVVGREDEAHLEVGGVPMGRARPGRRIACHERTSQLHARPLCLQGPRL